MATQVFITLGGGANAGIDDNDDILVEDNWGNRVFLGKATKKRFEQLKEYLDRLSIHAVDE